MSGPDIVKRRELTQLLVAGGFAAMVPAALAAGVPAMRQQSRRRIDLHQHFVPPAYREAVAAAGMTFANSPRGLPAWSEQSMLAMMDDLSIERAILSVVSPGVHFGDDAAARKLARLVNEEGSRLAAAYPGRIGFFASTPLPDVAGTVDEVIYALDRLGADGVIFESNFKGLYLGDAKLEPVYAELDKRKAVLFIHPTAPALSCGCGGAPATVKTTNETLGYPNALIEFMFETTRTVTNMVLSGTLAKFPDMRVLVPHAGATLPHLVGRIDAIAAMQGKIAPPSMRQALRQMHFDLAGMPVPEMLASLLKVADPKKLHYGSDWPHTPTAACKALAKTLDETPMLSTRLRSDIMFNNAATLVGKRERPGRT